VKADPPETSAQLDLVFARRSDRTVLERRLFRWPFVLTRTFALDSAPSHMLTVIMQTSSGAVQAEDRLRQRFHVGAGAAAHVTTQGASAVHRAIPGRASSETIALQIDDCAYFEYMPEPRILFPDAALEQTIDIDCAMGGVALVADGFTIHDPEARGRGFRRLISTTTLRCGGLDPVTVDRFDIGGLAGGRTAEFAAFGSLTLAAPGRREANAGLAEALSATLARVPDLYAAASLLPGEATGLGVRFAGRDLRAVKAGTKAAWRLIRQAFHGAPPPSRRKSDDDTFGPTAC
jgi:urease accessory protein